MKTTTTILAGLLLLAVGGRADAQATLGTSYNYFWTDTAGTTISSITAAPGSTVTVQLRMSEGGGGNIFTAAGGLNAYDATVTWNSSNLSFATQGGTTAENPNIKTNPYSVNGFNGPGAVRNNATAGINTAQTLNVSRGILNTSDPAFAVTSSAPGNVAGSVLLLQLTFSTGAATGDVSVVGSNRTASDSNFYFTNPSVNATIASYDTMLTATAPLTISVAPIPEPATVTGVGLLVVAVTRWVRRRPAGRVGGVRPGGPTTRLAV